MIGTGDTSYAQVDTNALTEFSSRLTTIRIDAVAPLQMASIEVENTLAALAEAISYWNRVLLDCIAALHAAETARERAEAQACIDAAQAKLASLRAYVNQVTTDGAAFKAKTQSLLINLSSTIAAIHERLALLGIYLHSSAQGSPSSEANHSEPATDTKCSEGKKDQQNDSQALISELKAKGIKFTEKDILFITRDKSGRIVWLEEGDKGRGLHHILYGQGIITNKEYKIGHISQFAKNGIVGRENIVSFIHSLLRNNKPVEILPGGEYIYSKRLKGEAKYIKMIIASNGYLVNSYFVHVK